MYTCECDGVDDFEDLYIGFGDGHDTVWARADNWVEYEDGECLILFFASDENLFGDAFLRDLYIIHDMEE